MQSKYMTISMTRLSDSLLSCLCLPWGRIQLGENRSLFTAQRFFTVLGPGPLPGVSSLSTVKKWQPGGELKFLPTISTERYTAPMEKINSVWCAPSISTNSPVVWGSQVPRLLYEKSIWKIRPEISKGALAKSTKNRSKFEIDALEPNKRQKNDLRTDRMSNMWFVCKKVQERRS